MVSVVDVVLASRLSRTKHEIISADPFFRAVNRSVYVPPVFPSEHTGVAFVFPFAVQNTRNRSPTTGVITSVGLVPDIVLPDPIPVLTANAMFYPYAD
jgi:hypothetical protein